MTPPSFSAPARPWSGDVLWLTLGFGILYFLFLGRLPLANPDEPRYAEIPREMLARGDWVTPRLNDVPYFEKPPLVYWTVAIARVVFGPGETAMRLTPALFALAGVLLTYAAARRLYGRDAGIGAAVVLGTCVMYFVLARLLLLDMAVSVLISATLFCFLLGVREPAPAADIAWWQSRRRWFFYGLYASAALATLAKGLIGFLLPGAVMFLWLLVFNQWHRLRPLYLPTGVALFLLIAAPWHVLAAQRAPGWAQFYFVHEHWERFTTTAHDRYEPFWFFAPFVIGGLFPWMGFLYPAVAEPMRAGWSRRKENADAWFFVTWALFIFLFFSKSQSKLIPYILPVFPPLALLIGQWLSRRWSEDAPKLLRVGLAIFAFVCGVAAAMLLIVAFKPGVIHDAEKAEIARPFAIALAATLLLGGVGAHWAARVRGVLSGLGTMVSTMLGFYLLILCAAPLLERPGTKTLALVARERMQPTDRVYHYWAFFHDFVYYTERPVGLVSDRDDSSELELQFLDAATRKARFIDDAELRREWAGPGRIWLVVRKSDQERPNSVFADPAFRYHLIAETRAHSLVSNQP